MKWAMELSEFDIWYKPKTAIKGQVLADFVMEFAPVELVEPTHSKGDLSVWKLSVDGASNAQGSGAGLILTSPEGIDIEYAHSDANTKQSKRSLFSLRKNLT